MWPLRLAARQAYREVDIQLDSMKPHPDRTVLVIAVVLVLGTLAVFWPVLQCDFLNYDDDTYVTANAALQQGLTVRSVAWAFETGHAGNWHPLTRLSHACDVTLYGLKPAGHHLTSLLLHAANALLLFLALRRMTGATCRSAVVAALFAWHPLHVESVAWVAERKDVLSAFFGILALWFYAGYAQNSARPLTQTLSPEGERGNVRCKPRCNLYWALLCFALGLMAKPMLVTLPFVLLLLDVWPLGRLGPGAGGITSWLHGDKAGRAKLLNLVREKLPFFALSVISCVITFWVQKSSGAVRSMTQFPFSERLANALVAYAAYVIKTLWPANLAAVYPHPHTYPVWQVLGAVLLLVAITAAVVRFAGRRAELAVGWFWFVGMLVPVIGLVQVGMQARADRYTYLPSIGLFIALVWLVAGVRPRSVPAALAAAALAGCIAGARHQLQFWQNSVTLFEHNLEVAPDSFLALNNLGNALHSLGKLEDARECYVKGLRVNPNSPDAHYNLGNVLVGLGKPGEAAEQYREALRCDPGLTDARNNLGVACSLLGQTNEAIAQFEEVLRQAPDFVKAHLALADLELRLDRPAEALTNYAAVIRLRPNDANAHYLAGRLLAADQPQAAIKEFGEAMRLKPDWWVPVWALAWLRATHPQAQVRNGAEALQLAERACALTGGQDARALDALGAAYAELGRYPEAQAAAQRASELAGATGKSDLARAIAERLALYREGKAYHSF